jgi:Xaa-Pro dipeptidase
MHVKNIFTKALFMAALFLISVQCMVSVSNAQPGVHTAKIGSEVLRLIRNEKLDLILPGAMRDNNVDMWIHVTRAGDPDPLAEQFGPTSGYLIFTDRGDRIERAVFGSARAVENIDIRGSLEITRAIEGYDYRTQNFSVYDEMREFVAERDPQTIAVNTSDWLAVADGISHSQYVKLEKILGPKYSARFISAENVITDFRVRRILREVSGMTTALETHLQILERSLTNEVIRPGITTLEDIGWWVREQFFKRGLVSGYNTLPGADIPRVLYSAQSERIDPPDVRWWIHHNDYVLQRGDFFTFKVGVRYLDYFSTDLKRNAYVMRDGETSVPESIQYAFDKALEAREIIRKNIIVGRTAGKTLEVIVSALENSDYIRVPFNDISTDGYEEIQKALANTDKSGFFIDLNSEVYSTGGLVTLGPSVAPFRQDRAHLKIQENYLFSLEFQVHTNLPERPGFPTSINIEGNHVVSSRGVEFLHPPNEKIILIH